MMTRSIVKEGQNDILQIILISFYNSLNNSSYKNELFNKIKTEFYE